MEERLLVKATLAGRRVLLRPPGGEDAHDAFDLVHRRQEILRWLVWQGPREPSDMADAFRDWTITSDEGANYHFAIVERASGAYAGSIGVRFAGHPGNGDVGYWIGEPFWGKGYGTEAVRLIARLAFRWLDADALCAWVFEGNAASRRVLEKNGFRYVRAIAARHPRPGAPEREWYFSLLRSDWAEAQDGWEPELEDVAFDAP
jgi:ribosomal-protein-alanine N-acetyltransferase